MGELCGSVDGVALGTDGSSSMILGYIGSWFPTCLCCSPWLSVSSGRF